MPLKKQLCAVFCWIVVAQVSAESEPVPLPSSVKICQHESKDYDTCLRDAIQDSWPIFMNGIPELGLPRLEPFVTDLLMGKYVVVRNYTTYGLSNAKITEVRSYRKGIFMNIEFDLEMPKVVMEGHYEIDIPVLQFSIGGKGYANITMQSLTSTFSLEGDIIDDTWVLQHFRTNFMPKKSKVYFSDLFHGNEELNRAARKFVNDNRQALFIEYFPIIESFVDKYFTDFLNQFVFSKISVAKTFP